MFQSNFSPKLHPTSSFVCIMELCAKKVFSMKTDLSFHLPTYQSGIPYGISVTKTKSMRSIVLAS